MRGVLLQNLRLAIRGLMRERAVTLVAVGSLAIGIGANASIFSLLQAVEFPSLIYPNASRIVFLESDNQARDFIGMPVSAPDARDVAAVTRTMTLPSLTSDQSSILGDGAARVHVTGRRVEPTFFAVMGVPASRGRVLSTADTFENIVVSDRLWRGTLRADPAIVGQPVHLDGGIVTVVGVMPPRFDDADFWVTLPPEATTHPRDDRQFSMFARLAPHASVDDATRELAEISGRLSAAAPSTNKDWVMFATPITRLHGRDSRGTFVLLQGAVAIVLLIACANIANILLARGTRRRHEMALRIALGATRRHLIGQLLTESVLLSMVGGAFGVLIAMWGIRLARTVGGILAVIDPTLNGLVLGFTAALTMLTGIVCGIVPALRASRVAPETALRAEGGRGGSSGPGVIRAALVALQVASAVVLATCGALMIETLANRTRVDLGFDPRGAIRADVALTFDRYRDDASRRAAVAATLDRLAAQPEVAAAGISTWALPTGAGAERQMTLPDDRDAPLPSGVRRAVEAVTPRYFDALGAPLEYGRAFTDADGPGAAPIAIVNDELAKHLWPSRNPIGARLRLGAPGEAVPTVTVVGVVATMRRSAMHDVAVGRVYLPYAQYPGPSLSFVVRGRAAADTRSMSRALQAAVESTDPDLMVDDLRTVEEDLAQFVAPVRLVTSLLGGFGLAGVLLAALGVFGTMSYVVSQREREMAVRSALGAKRVDLVWLVLRHALVLTAIGLLPGIAAAIAAARALGSFLYGVGPTDAPTLAAVVAGLIIVSVIACYRPARAAASVDPMAILRRE